MKLKHKLSLGIIASCLVVASVTAIAVAVKKHHTSEITQSMFVRNDDFHLSQIEEKKQNNPIIPKRPREELKKEEEKPQEIPKEEPKVEDVPKEVPKKEEEKPQETPKEEPKVKEPPKEEPKVEEPRKEEPKEEPKIEEPRKEELKEEPKIEEPRKEELKEEPKEEPKIEEPSKKEEEKNTEKPKKHEEIKEDKVPQKSITDSELPAELQVFPKQITVPVEVDGLNEQVTLQPQPNRIYFKSDVEAGIVNKNPDPYLAERVPDVIEFNPSEAFIKKQVEKSKKSFEARSFGPWNRNEIQNLSQDDVEKIIAQGGHDEYNDNELARHNSYLTTADKYWLLIHKSNKWKEFVYDGTPPEKITELENLPKDVSPHTKKSVARILKILTYIDFNKFTKLSKKAEEQIRDGGYSLDDSNSYIDENGEINSYSFEPLPGTNKVTSRLSYDNEKRRVFGYKSHFNRSSQNLIEGTYEGWTKSTDTELANKYNTNNISGIKFEKLKRVNPEQGQRNEGRVLTIDLAKNDAYQHTVGLLEQLKKDHVVIESYRFLNIGSAGANQSFYKIVKALPKKLLQLEFFFVKKDTSALMALEEKDEIKELGLYTNELPYDDAWRINPWALKNVHWINTNDYNPRENTRMSYKPWSRIMFTSLIFYENDINKNTTNLAEKLNRINYGLRMAYFTRNNEPFFNGEMGGGLKPDHNEGGNSYPWGLDLSNTSLKSLRGLVFTDHKKNTNGTRKLKYLWLKNESSVFEISTDELNNAQFKDIMILEQPQMPRTKIFFSNKDNTKFIKVVPGTESLNANGIANLKVLKEYADSSYIKSNPILVDPQNEDIKNKLTSSFPVKTDDGAIALEIA
ncbi:putative immunoglobulin-blocking virulence protein [Ureaplasma zalophigenitalium]|uniref:Immunoglobulin-blocking virulence protein n=1 Tax=Ureaplasma zalophigenitalium TaxID=907723 RepID=A0ABT3BPD7_9BACT|nr:putative immunoglobulin-blocking virulence protein [Ureaplasma zalophigenitalium]MCV3754105.1 putative immunoglobulin-blocking virulence protein [Ureaplasma zalophigenitalium]